MRRQRAQRARQFQLWDDAIAYLNQGKASDPVAEDWWYERRTLIRQLLSAGDAKRAYAAASIYTAGPEGRLVVIDLKTGKTTAVAAADLEEHAQLAGYQAAVEAGAFADHGAESGGAALVQLGPGKDAREQMQVPLADATDPQWAYAMVRRTAETMAAATFSAVANSRCRVCPVRTSCPISGKGRQVVEDTQ